MNTENARQKLHPDAPCPRCHASGFSHVTIVVNGGLGRSCFTCHAEWPIYTHEEWDAMHSTSKPFAPLHFEGANTLDEMRPRTYFIHEGGRYIGAIAFPDPADAARWLPILEAATQRYAAHEETASVREEEHE